MAKIIEHKEVPIADLVIGKSQIRVSQTAEGIEDLAESIKVLGLLQPIVICKSAEMPGKWEILAGQRRFLAHQFLGKKTISAIIRGAQVEAAEAKAISITENTMRRKLTTLEQKDGIIFLYNRYGTIKDVVKTTGLPYDLVQACVKYPRLLPELKEMVDKEEIDINTALKAQDASVPEKHGEPDPSIAVTLAEELKVLSNAQQKKVVKLRAKNPTAPIEDIIEKSKTPDNVVQMLISLSTDTSKAINSVATTENLEQPDAAVLLIDEALNERGLLQAAT